MYRAEPQVTGVSGTEVYCTANNDATLGGLLTVFHTERSSDSLTNVQNSLPVRLPELTPRALHVSVCQPASRTLRMVLGLFLTHISVATIGFSLLFLHQLVVVSPDNLSQTAW